MNFSQSTGGQLVNAVQIITSASSLLPSDQNHVLFLICVLSLHGLFAVGPSGIPCQLMVGFFAYAKSLEINVDKEELEGTFFMLCHCFPVLLSS